MPIIKSSKKSVKTDKEKTIRNNFYMKTVKNAIKNTDKLVAAKDVEAAKEALAFAIKSIDKAASKGLMKKNTAAREKTRLNKNVKDLAA